MSPFRLGLNRLLSILYHSGHQNPAAQHNADPETERRVPPKELMSHVVKLNCKSTAEPGVCDVYVVGTTHYSEESCRQVKAMINFLKPQVVFLEWPSSGTVRPQQGSEFRIANDEASKYGGKVVFGDRPPEVSLQRMWRNTPFWRTTLSGFSLLCNEFFQSRVSKLIKMLDESNDCDTIAFVLQEMSKMFPTLVETMVYERDRYMSCTLLKVAKEHNLVVAIVGRGHLQGIKKNWGQPISLEELLEVPKMNPILSAMKIFGFLQLEKLLEGPKKKPTGYEDH